MKTLVAEFESTASRLPKLPELQRYFEKLNQRSRRLINGHNTDALDVSERRANGVDRRKVGHPNGEPRRSWLRDRLLEAIWTERVFEVEPTSR